MYVSFLSSIWVLRDDAASDCQLWHPLLLRLVGQWQSSSLGLGRGVVVEVQFSAVADTCYVFRSIVTPSKKAVNVGGYVYVL